MNLPNLNQHLTHEQICDLILSISAASSGYPGTTPDYSQDSNRDYSQDYSQNYSQDTCQDHLRSCLICASEFELLLGSVSAFRSAAVAVTEHSLARRPIPAAPSSSSLLDRSRAQRSLSPMFFWAATALLFTAAIPIGLFRSNLNPYLKHHQSPVAVAGNTTAPGSSTESDEALLEGIDRDLAASVPSPMQPLTGYAAVTSAQLDSQFTSQTGSSPQSQKE